MMTPSRSIDGHVRVLLQVLVLTLLFAAPSAWAQSVTVTSANPPSTIQGTVNLNVTLNGKGFKNGATAKWFVTGTTNPGGVTVNSTTFVSGSQLTANITVASDATVSGYDIVVANAGTNGGSGKGTDLFAVMQAAQSGSCTVQPLPSGISLQGTLNYVTSTGVAAYGPDLGVTVRARQMVLGGTNVVVVGVATPGPTPGKLEIFLLDPISGNLLDGTTIGTNTAVQPHITVSFNAGGRSLAVGDVNGDGIPDFAAGSTATNTANAAIGSISNGILSYQPYPLAIPSNAAGVGFGVAMGNLGHSDDDIAVGAIGAATGQVVHGSVLLYTWNGSGFTNYLNIQSPIPNSKTDEKFGNGVAIADVSGGSANDLIVGAANSVVNGVTTGRVFVFPGPVSPTNYFSLASGGLKVAAGDIDGNASTNGYMDLLDASGTNALVYGGPVTAVESPSFGLQPISALGAGWSNTEPDVSDVNGDGLADVVVGAYGASSGQICGGATYLWLSSPGAPLATEQVLTTPVANAGQFGDAVAFAPGTRLFFVTDQRIQLGSTSRAGQVYVYKVN